LKPPPRTARAASYRLAECSGVRARRLARCAAYACRFCACLTRLRSRYDGVPAAPPALHAGSASGGTDWKRLFPPGFRSRRPRNAVEKGGRSLIPCPSCIVVDRQIRLEEKQ
jgi:hypothetical protein